MCCVMKYAVMHNFFSVSVIYLSIHFLCNTLHHCAFVAFRGMNKINTWPINYMRQIEYGKMCIGSHCMSINNIEIIYPSQKFCTTYALLTFPQIFCKLQKELIMFIDKPLK